MTLILALDQIHANTGRLEDGRQAASRMRTPASQPYTLNLLESVVWPQCHHLSQIMREVEGCSFIDIQLVLPLQRGHMMGHLDPSPKIGERRNAFQSS
ncbi:hypothetical protein D1872_301690 [compost metagenome]